MIEYTGTEYELIEAIDRAQDREGMVWTSIQDIADDLMMAEVECREALDGMAVEGLVVSLGGRGRNWKLTTKGRELL